MKCFFLLLLLTLNFCFGSVPRKDYKPNVFVTSDVSNEPDDAEAIVRLLLYTNEISLKGLIATTSFWLNDTTREQDIIPIINAYGKVHQNLLKHSPDYPSAAYLKSITSHSHPVYGLAAFEEEEISPGARLLIDAVDSLPANETLHVLIWGGALVLAEGLREIMKRDELSITDFTSKLHVFAISEQDDTGPWIRANFPHIPYVASLTGFNQYGVTTWVGVSGEKYNSFDYGGPDSSLVSKQWLKKNIQSVGPLGAVYPTYEYNMEGDTSSTLSVIPNGLNYPLHPEYGGWGGRYIHSDLSGRINHYADAADYVVGMNNQTFVSNKLTVWRWRDAYQHDFALRMQWTIKGFNETSHSPIVTVNGSSSVLPLEISATIGSKVVLDASKSYDLNNNQLKFKWFHYYDISMAQGNRIEVPEIKINGTNDDNSIVEFQVPGEKLACVDAWGKTLKTCRIYHIILEVTNVAKIPTREYKRIVVFSKRP